MQIEKKEMNGKTVVLIHDECRLFYRMNDERDYRISLDVDKKRYWFSALKTDCPFASVSLTLHENTNKRTIFTLKVEFDRLVSVSP